VPGVHSAPFFKIGGNAAGRFCVRKRGKTKTSVKDVIPFKTKNAWAAC